MHSCKCSTETSPLNSEIGSSEGISMIGNGWQQTGSRIARYRKSRITGIDEFLPWPYALQG